MADSTIQDIATRATLTGTTKIPVGSADSTQRFTDPDDLDAFFLATYGASRIILTSINGTPGALNAASGVQAAFPTGQRTATLLGNTSYLMEGRYILATGGTTHTTAMAFLAGGGLTIQTGGCEYVTYTHSGAANAIVTSNSAKHHSGLASSVLNATSTAVRTIITFEGLLRINAGGTLTPQINFSANPTGTNQMLSGSFFRLTPIGSGTNLILPPTGIWA